MSVGRKSVRNGTVIVLVASALVIGSIGGQGHNIGPMMLVLVVASAVLLVAVYLGDQYAKAKRNVGMRKAGLVMFILGPSRRRKVKVVHRRVRR